MLFCDIRGFTSLADNQTPEATIELLNGYYALMFDAIGSHGGIVSLMIGDGLMAIFGAPQALDNPPQQAVDAAREMLTLIEGYNAEQRAIGSPEIAIGIGIATGDVVAGYAGTHDRATYTCIGATVNRVAGLESHTKSTENDILIDDATRAAMTAGPEPDPVGAVALQGSLVPIEVFAVA